MVTISIKGGAVILEVEGLDKIWTLRSRLQIPLTHIRGIHPAPEDARRWFHGLRLAGTHIPGVISAGTFYQDGGLVFWDVHDPEKAIALDLTDERYKRLVIEVADPAATIRFVQPYLTPRPGEADQPR